MRKLAKFMVCAVLLVMGIVCTSCSKDDEGSGVSVDSVVVKHTMNLSENLMNFALVDVTYSDADGNTISKIIDRHDWLETFEIREFPTTINMAYEFSVDPRPKDDWQPGTQYTFTLVGAFEAIGRLSDGTKQELKKENFYFNGKSYDVNSYINGIKDIKFRATFNRSSNGSITVDYQAL